MKDVRDRVAVVSGAGSGIGRSLALALAARGADVVIADVDAAGLADTAAGVVAAGRRAVTVPTDVSDPAQVEALAETAYSELGAVHLLFNNAGVHVARLTWETTPEDWQWVYGVNFWGVVHTVGTFVPRMLEAGEQGHIVNTASLAGIDVATSSAVYSSSKFAVVALTECLQRDLDVVGAPIGVSVLCPGPVQTEISRSARNRPAALAATDQPGDAALTRMTATGISPDTVAALTLDAVADGRFFIDTDAMYDEFVEVRIDHLRSRRRPTRSGEPSS